MSIDIFIRKRRATAGSVAHAKRSMLRASIVLVSKDLVPITTFGMDLRRSRIPDAHRPRANVLIVDGS
jgi:hypothetical protein